MPSGVEDTVTNENENGHEDDGRKSVEDTSLPAVPTENHFL